MQTLREIYDVAGAPRCMLVTDAHLAAWLALMHLASPEALNDAMPVLDTDDVLVWDAADSPELRRVLRREPEAVTCPQLGTRFPRPLPPEEPRAA